MALHTSWKSTSRLRIRRRIGWANVRSKQAEALGRCRVEGILAPLYGLGPKDEFAAAIDRPLHVPRTTYTNARPLAVRS